MRCVGDEGTLRVERRAEPPQQAVQGRHQRRHLDRQAARGERLQRLFIALAQPLRQALQGRERGRCQPPHHQRQHGGCEEQRRDAVQRRIGRELTPDLAQLRDLDHPVACGHAEGAPGLALRGDVGKAQRGPLGQAAVRARRVQAAAVDSPDLDHEVELLVGQRTRLAGRDGALVAQRKRHLAQLVVEQRFGLGEHAAVGQAAHHQRGHRQRGQQPQQQARANRFHSPAPALAPTK